MPARFIKRQDTTSIITGGTTSVGTPTGTTLPLNTNASPVSFANPSTSVNPPPASSTTAASNANDQISAQQPIPVRTLVAICVAAFILIGGLVIFVLWFGARKKEKKFDSQLNGIDYKGAGSGIMEGTTTGTAEDVQLKGGYPPTNPTTVVMPRSLASEHSSYYSQSTGKGRNPYPIRRPATGDSMDQQQQQPYTIPENYTSYADTSFLPKQDVYSRNDMAPASPVSPASPSARQPADMYHSQEHFTSHDAPHSSPRSNSAQAIVRPYNVGAHPYSSPHLRSSSIGNGSRTSIEHSGNYTIATALPEPETVGLGADHYSQSSPGAATFAQAGARPGYDAYGIESSRRPIPNGSTFTTQQAGRQPIQSLNARPSLESIRSIARKASIDRTAAEAATEFIMGGPQAVGTRSRNNSIGSSTRGKGAVSVAGGPGYTSSVYSTRSNKSSGGKEKLTKSEKKREMEAMDNLIAALDESALREKRRKDALAEAAGLSGAGPSSSVSKNGDESDASVRRRKDMAVTGSYPLPPPDVFRAALASAGRGRDSQVEDEVDDEEIERWRRR